MGDKVKGRVKLITDAQLILPDEEGKGLERFDDMKDREVKCAVVKEVTGFECTKEHSDVYVDARYDAALEQAEKHDDAMGKTRAQLTREDVGTESRSDTAEADMWKRHANAWKGSAE
jgi:hypothetical protein